MIPLVRSVTVCAIGFALAVGCTVSSPPSTATLAAPTPTAAPTQTVAPTPTPTGVQEPPATAVPEPAVVVPSIELSESVLVSDGTTIVRLQPDGSTEEMYRTDPGSYITDFASDGDGGVLFQEGDPRKENDNIAWLVDSQVSYPIVAEPDIRLDLVGVVTIGGAPHVLYQHVDSCCGALESEGTLRVASLADGSERAIRRTGAWETVTDFSAFTGAALVAIEGAHETADVIQVDPVTGETLATVPVGDLYGAVVATGGGFLFAHIVGTDDDAMLEILTIDQAGTLSTLAAVPGHAALHVNDMYLDDGRAVVSFEHREGIRGRTPQAIIVDLATGEFRYLEVPGIARPDRAPVTEAVPMVFDSLTFEDVAFEEFRLFLSKDDVIGSLGEPTTTTEFEWAGDATGYILDYGDLVFEIHYDVSSLVVRRPGSCTSSGVCVGQPFSSLERTLGFGYVSLLDLGPGETRRVDYDIPGSGYCNAQFSFGLNPEGAEVLQEISARCLPD